MSPHKISTQSEKKWTAAGSEGVPAAAGATRRKSVTGCDPPAVRKQGDAGPVCVWGRKTDWGWDKEPKVERDKGRELRGAQSAASLFFLGGPVCAFHKQQLRVLILSEWVTERQIKASPHINTAVFPSDICIWASRSTGSAAGAVTAAVLTSELRRVGSLLRIHVTRCSFAAAAAAKWGINDCYKHGG